MINTQNKKPPMGVFTLALFSLALIYTAYDYISPKSPCEQLTSSLSKGYFMQWTGDSMILVTADKQQYQVVANDQLQACIELMNELKVKGN